MVRVWEKIRPLAGSRGAGRPGTLRENARRARTLRRLKRFPKFEFEAKARPHGFGQSIFIDGQDLESRLSLFHRLSCSLVPDTLIQERFTNSP